jgi:L-arabinose 1-dehydrogenase [NAD(P)+]
MAQIAISGASGNVGQELLKGFDAHEVTPLTHDERDEMESIAFDIMDRDAFVEALTDQDVLIHLAANPSPRADWESVSDVNIDGVYNAYEAAVENELDRVVFASSNHAVNMYARDDPRHVESMTTGYAPPVDPDDPPRPDSYYGITKAAGEAMGSYYVDRHGIEVVNTRIGWLMTRDELADTQGEGKSEEERRFAQAMWLSPRDCRQVMEKAATASIPDAQLTVHAISRNDERFLSLTQTLRALDYQPRDNATEALSET